MDIRRAELYEYRSCGKFRKNSYPELGWRPLSTSMYDIEYP